MTFRNSIPGGLLPLALAGLLPLAGCRDAATPMAPDESAVETIAAGRFGGPPPHTARLLERETLAGDVVHYAWEIRVGSGPYDVIRLHRVVREPPSASGRPLRQLEGVLLLPGMPQLFEGIFLPSASPAVSAERGSVALYLASHDIDVWGMDYGWTAVPFESPGVVHLDGWGIDKDTRHVQAALTQARWLRATSGQGAGPIHLLGFSYGGFLLYAVADDDTQRPGNLKNIKGIIPVDGSGFQGAPGSAGQANACKQLPAIAANLAAGVHVSDGSIFAMLGQAARTEPDAPSSIYPPFNNFQAALAMLVDFGFLGGSYTATPPSVTLLFTHGPRVVDLLADTPPYSPYQLEYDQRAARCGSATYPVSFDDHVADIEVPILFIARGAGAFYTTTLTSSDDVTRMLLNPTFDPSLYGHADLFLADGASDVVWHPILEWIRDHE